MIENKVHRIPRSKSDSDTVYKKAIHKDYSLDLPRGGQKAQPSLSAPPTQAPELSDQHSMQKVIADLRAEIICGETEKALEHLLVLESNFIKLHPSTKTSVFNEVKMDNFKELLAKSVAPDVMNCDFLFKSREAKVFVSLRCNEQKRHDRLFISSDLEDMPLYCSGIVNIPSSYDFFNLMHGKVSLSMLWTKYKLSFNGNDKFFAELLEHLDNVE